MGCPTHTALDRRTMSVGRDVVAAAAAAAGEPNRAMTSFESAL